MESKFSRTRPVHEQQALNSVTMFLTANFAELHGVEESKRENVPSESLFSLGEDEPIDEQPESSNEEDRAGELLLQVFHLKLEVDGVCFESF
jgi:hypothetical protein